MNTIGERKQISYSGRPRPSLTSGGPSSIRLSSRYTVETKNRSAGQQGWQRMKRRILAWFTAIILLSSLATPVRTAAANSNRHRVIITFDAPGAVNGTFARNINPDGAIVGSYQDINFAGRGFLRASDGTITEFDPPGSIYTGPEGINPAGVITGFYQDARMAGHGFVRAASGTFTVFDVPGSTGTGPVSINPAGTVAGFYYDVNTISHGFLRAPDGTLTTVDAAGAVFGTVCLSINPAGAVAGFYYDANAVSHGFLRDSNGKFTTFDVPGAGTGPVQGTGLNTVSVNPAGEITGTYVDASNTLHGFLRAAGGAITAFDPAGSVSTIPYSINPAGVITGSYTDASGTSHGFLAK